MKAVVNWQDGMKFIGAGPGVFSLKWMPSLLSVAMTAESARWR